MLGLGPAVNVRARVKISSKIAGRVGVNEGRMDYRHQHERGPNVVNVEHEHLHRRCV